MEETNQKNVIFDESIICGHKLDEPLDPQKIMITIKENENGKPSLLIYSRQNETNNQISIRDSKTNCITIEEEIKNFIEKENFENYDIIEPNKDQSSKKYHITRNQIQNTSTSEKIHNLGIHKKHDKDKQNNLTEKDKNQFKPK